MENTARLLILRCAGRKVIHCHAGESCRAEGVEGVFWEESGGGHGGVLGS